MRWYYDHLYRRDRQRESIDFESKVSQIARNFMAYLRNHLEKAFTEVVLFSFQYNQQLYKQHAKLPLAPYEEAKSPNLRPSTQIRIVTEEKKQ